MYKSFQTLLMAFAVTRNASSAKASRASSPCESPYAEIRNLLRSMDSCGMASQSRLAFSSQ